MRALVRICTLVVLVACLGVSAVSAATTTSKTREIPVSYLLRGLPPPAPQVLGSLTPLRAGVTYQASAFPLPLRVRPFDGSWGGAQWKSELLGFRGGGRPYFGWVAIGSGNGEGYAGRPAGLIVIMTAYARTPSVASTVANLRTRGHGATYEATSSAKVAGFSGVQFDGQVVGQSHVFIPFSPPPVNHFQDAHFLGQGEVFRVTVLNVRGKTVVVFVESGELPAEQFPAFLTKADRILETVRFPA